MQVPLTYRSFEVGNLISASKQVVVFQESATFFYAGIGLVCPRLIKLMKQKLINGLNLFLMLDFLLVIVFMVWLGVAVLGRSLQFPLGLDLWYKLWQPMIQPAIGILMAGALVSGLVNWVTDRLNARQQNQL